MTPGARAAAAIEVLSDVEARRRPAADALKDWGLARRYAGSGDRAAVGALVHDALRRRASARWLMGAETPRATVIGALRLARGQDAAAIDALLSGEGHAPARLDSDEAAALAGDADARLAAAPRHVRGDYPEWLDAALAAALGDAVAEEGAALARRAPVDLRVNLLKAVRPAALAELAHLAPTATPHAPEGLRLAPRADGRAPALGAEAAYLEGRVEVQDEGSMLAARLAGAREGEQVLDLCAGGGGKALALAALMNNRGQVHATDLDARRLAPIRARIERAGARNVQVRQPRGRTPDLDGLAGTIDLALVDAPCTGVGAWRRNPDAKWRVRPGALEQRCGDQAAALDLAAGALREGGRLAYVTCSLLDAENGDQVSAFLARHPGFALVPPAEVAAAAGLDALGAHVDAGGRGLLLSPLRTGTDGFFVALMRRAV